MRNLIIWEIVWLGALSALWLWAGAIPSVLHYLFWAAGGVGIFYWMRFTLHAVRRMHELFPIKRP